ncbi:MAG: SRPBCC family protein [Ilumatobacteraceae bacterium]
MNDTPDTDGPEYRLDDRPGASAAAVIEATPEAVWAIVTDITFPGRHSDEFRSAVWLDGAGGPALGARFEGRNANEMMGEWTTVSTVTACREHAEFAWAVADPSDPICEWGFTLTAVEGGTLVEQWNRLGTAPSGITVAIASRPDKEHRIIAGRLAQQRRNMVANLDGIAAALAAPISHR